ncbi:MAG: beta-aspartyl-peptidase [Deltaproteobacteria bacterium]|nr:beta-aspartyl-peptidase [Deltaproteobacteria bacterium]
MFTLIRGGRIYAPAEMGNRDILIAAGKIARIADRIDFPQSFNVAVVEAKGKIVTPAFIDLHVHIIGGGGEGGHSTRVPEIQLSRITRAGVTTVLGVIGTDDVTRHPESLLAKAMGLEQEGISAYIMVGSYQFPPITITGSVRKDVALIPNVVGVGEIAISDHRSSQPSFEDLAKVAAEARVGGMLGGKAGLVQLHIGEGVKGLEYLFRLAEETEIPIEQFLPTHITRTPAVFDQAIRLAQMGGNVDITASGKKLNWRMSTSEALGKLLSARVPVERITLSSDSNGSMPMFDEKGALIRLAVGDIQNLYEDFRCLVSEEGFPVSDVLKCVTLNPARRIRIDGHKGSLEEGMDADLIVFDADWEIDKVYSMGRLMVSEGKPMVKGTFE